MIGLAFSACLNVTYDMLGTALLLKSKLEVDRLGNMLEMVKKLLSAQITNKSKISNSQVGWNKNDDEFSVKEFDEEMNDLNEILAKFQKSHSKTYAELVKCIIFHKKLVE
jgi:hypothetical protein